jgi:predicted transcriptional regulator
MLSIASQVSRRCATGAMVSSQSRHQLQLRAGFAQTVKEGLTATDAWSKSCYSDIDYTINENLPVYEAVQKFAAYNVGCLVTTDDNGETNNEII